MIDKAIKEYLSPCSYSTDEIGTEESKAVIISIIL